MSRPFDIGLDTLAGRAAPAPEGAGVPQRGTFYIETFGCQMNDHDTEKVAGLLLARGYRPADSPATASFLLYNTCSIREKAAQKVYSRLGEFNTQPETGRMIGVLGCLAQQEGETMFQRSPWVGLVCGSASYHRLPELLARIEAGERRVTGLDTDTDATFETEMTRRDNPLRAYLTIMEGCDKKCSYCVVPYTRGPERSRASEAVLEEARQLAGLGYTEIQLLGQTVNSYRDPGPRALRFSELLLAVAGMPGVRRVRFTTSHPRDFTPDIVAAMDAHPSICEHVHLPVQSGSARVLGEMERGYTLEEYLEKIALLRAARRKIAITTDLIVGFPGETQGDFEATLALLDTVRFDAVFAFKYSPRPNTPALRMADAIPEEEKSRRLAVLLERQRQIQFAAHKAVLGRSFEVLVSGRARKENQWSGYTSSYRLLNFTSPHPELLGQYVQVRVTGAGANSLSGEQVL